MEDSLCWHNIELFYGQKFVFASRVAQCMQNLILFWTFKLKHLGLLVWLPYNLLVILILDMCFCNLFSISVRQSVDYSWTIPLRPFLVNLSSHSNPSSVVCCLLVVFVWLIAIANILSCSLGYLRRITWVNAVPKQGSFWQPFIVSHLELYHWLKQGSPYFFVRGPHKLLHTSSRAGHLT